MTKQVKKKAKAPVLIKNISVPTKRVVQAVHALKEIHEEGLKTGFKKAEVLAHNTHAATTEVMDISTTNIQAWNEFGSIATSVFTEVGSEMMESYRNSFSDCVKTSQEALKCQTASDMADLQSKALQRMTEGYFDKLARVSQILFEGCTKAMAPLNECTAVSTDQMCKLLAA